MTADRGISAYYSAGGLNIETYDERFRARPGTVDGDVAWYIQHARECGGPVLELGSGTGRVTWALADAGVHVVGLELLPSMIQRAESKRESRTPRAAGSARFVQGDMTDFTLGEEFALVIVPFRGFQSLVDVDAQRRSLAAIRRHLAPSGRLHLDLFDPRLDWLLPGDVSPPIRSLPPVRHPRTGNQVEVEIIQRVNDPVRQLLRERWQFTERDARGRVLRQEFESLELRWSYRYEIRHLLELSGFVVEAEYSDFSGAPPAYGREQVLIARRGGDHPGA